MRIICDTNVWYDISSGKIKKETFSSFRLHPTYVNLIELSRSPNLITNIKIVQDAVRALNEFNGGILEQNPIEYIIRKQFPEYPLKDDEHKIIFEGFEKLLKADLSTKLDEKVVENMTHSIEKWKRGLQESADKINSLLPQIRENIKNTTGKKVHREEQSIPIFYEVLNVFVKEYTKDKFALDVSSYPWHEIELFIRVWDNFFKELEVSPSQKFQPNDWLDLFAMVYTLPEYKFSTSEKKWIRIIESDTITKPYLIDLSKTNS